MGDVLQLKSNDDLKISWEDNPFTLKGVIQAVDINLLLAKTKGLENNTDDVMCLIARK